MRYLYSVLAQEFSNIACCDESLACGVNPVVRLHDVEAWVLEELLPHLLVELLGEEE